MQLLELVRHMGGAARRSTLLAAGVPQRVLAAAETAGDLTRPFRGTYALPRAPKSIALAAYFNARVSCVSAATTHGLRSIASDPQAHLELDAERGGRRAHNRAHAHAVLHRTRTYRPGSLLVDVARAIDMSSRCITRLEQLVMLDHALQRGDVTEEDVLRFEITPAPQVAWLLREADAKSESVSETCARVALRAAGFDVESQVWFPGIGRVDLVINDRLILEVDSKAHHLDPKAFARDRRRDRLLVGCGIPAIRCTYHDAVDKSERLVHEVRRALAGLEAIGVASDTHL